MYLPQLLEILKDPEYIPLSVDRLAERMSVPEKEFTRFKREVGQHLRQGTLVKLKKNRICLPRDADLITGLIRFRQSGSATLYPDDIEGTQKRPPYQINAEDTHVAMHGDRVVGRIHHDRRRFRSRPRRNQPAGNADGEQVRIIRILERANTTLTGTLKRSRMFHYVIPDDPRIIQDILVPDPRNSKVSPKPKVDDKVIVKLANWEQRHLNPEGTILKVLGKTHTPAAEYQALLHQYDLNPEFPEAVRKEVAGIGSKVTKEDTAGREDLRDHYTLTIDPQDAKDFDDALSLKKEADGTFSVGIHIADVGHYVRPGTALDREARKRGNSTYLVGTVIPMLPHALSNGICSLVEDEDRLTKTVFIKFSQKGQTLSSRFANTVIRSNKRLTYEQAFALLFEDNLDIIVSRPDPPAHQTGSTGRSLKTLDRKELIRMQRALRDFWQIAKRLRAKRMNTGSLELDMPETKIYVDPDGYAEEIVRVEQDESHQLIEEFMLAANQAVACAINEKKLPGIHRVHDEPDPEKLDEFNDYLETFGIHAGDLSIRKNLNRILVKLKSHPQAHLLRLNFLRSLKRACYRASADGHFGLAFRNYTHFTSPIRRYADLVVHRIFARHLTNSANRFNRKRYTTSELATIAQHLSLTEENSTEAERESVKIKMLEFFERELSRQKKSVFEAVILEVRNHGMFIELTESMVYGLIHISTLRDDLYKVNGTQTAVVGRRKGNSFSVGDKIKVSVARVDRFKRQFDFVVADS